MPIYNFLCEKCDHITEDLQPMNKEKEPVACEVCKGETEFTLQMRANRIAGEKERVSSALGVDPSQIADGSVFKIHPGAKFNANGDMILKDRGEQKQRLKERGWVDKDTGKGWY